jgi:glycine hydroxymethyltransferase
MHTIAAIAVALQEADSDTFRDYARQCLINAKVMADEFVRLGYSLVTGGTDNHLIVIDFTSNPANIPDGKTAEHILDMIGISTSKSTIPNDPNPPFRPSGLRIGTPAMTTRGVK